MHKSIFAIILSAMMLVACSGENLTKEQYYERGIQLLDKGNVKGATVAFKKAIEKDQNYYEARYRLALAYMKDRKIRNAESELEKVQRLNPTLVEVHLPLARIYLSKGEIDKAFKEMDLYMKSVKDDPEAYEVMAAAYSARRDFKNAELMLNASQKISPKRIESKAALASVYLRNKNTEDAESLINEILQEDDRNKQALYLLASLKRAQGKNDEELAAFEKINEVDPKDTYAKFKVGFHYLLNNEIEKARKIGKELVNTQRRRPEGHYLMGLVQYFEQKTDDAIISLQKTVKIAPIPGAYYYLGLCHLSKGNFEQAVSELQRVADLRPGMIQPRLMLAIAHMKAGRADIAEKDAKKVIEMDERNAFAHNLLGTIYLARGKNELAMEEIDRAVELNPDFIDTHLKKALINLSRGDSKKAEQEFIEAIEVAPDVINSRIILAKYYIKKGKNDEAIKTLSEGLKNNRNDAILYSIMGVAYLGKKDIDKAFEYFRKSKETNPEFLQPYYSMGLVYLAQGEKEKAIEEYLKVLEMDSDNLRVLLMLARIMEKDNKDDKALDYYLRAKKQKKPVAYIALAEYYLRKKDSDKAMKELEEVLSYEKKNVRAMALLGAIHMENKDYNSALTLFKDIEALAPELGYKLLAEVYNATGEYDKAIKELKKLKAKQTDDKKILTNMRLIELYMRMKNFKDAEGEAEEIISLKPESELGYLSLASINNEQRFFDKALYFLGRAEEINSENINVKMTKGRIYLSINPAKALKIFKEIEATNPDNVSASYYQAQAYEMMEDKKAATKKYEETLEKFPGHLPALNNLAYLYTEGYGPLDEAVVMAEKAYTFSPKSGSIMDTYGWALYKKGNYDQAMKLFKDASDQLPDNPTIRHHLALAYIKKGMTGKAEKELEKAIVLGRKAPFPEIDEAKKTLEELNK